MKCPKCSHDQTGKVECEKCGIIFERYLARMEKLAKEQQQAAQPSADASLSSAPIMSSGGNSSSGWMVSGVLAILLAGTWGYYTYFRTAPVSDQTAAMVAAAPTFEDETVDRVRPAPQETGVFKNQNNNASSGSAIEQARRATVFIKTPWGSGSGVFVSNVGHVITNRHVVEFNKNTLNDLKRKAAELDNQLRLEAKNIEYLKKQLPRLPKELYEQGESNLRRRMESYAKYQALSEDIAKKLRSIETASWVSDIEVVMYDGSTYRVESFEAGKSSDLALLTVDCLNSPSLMPVKNSLGMPQGEAVYTVGNPVGLRHTVTSGIVSGYREYRGSPYIQTDAAINPGNSGGPLVDKQGRLLGINTMILRDTEGIGFAIPYKTVKEEFGALLP